VALWLLYLMFIRIPTIKPKPQSQPSEPESK
jgi:hypothetical protein